MCITFKYDIWDSSESYQFLKFTHQVYHVLQLDFNQLVFCYSVYVID